MEGSYDNFQVTVDLRGRSIPLGPTTLMSFTTTSADWVDQEWSVHGQWWHVGRLGTSSADTDCDRPIGLRFPEYQILVVG